MGLCTRNTENNCSLERDMKSTGKIEIQGTSAQLENRNTFFSLWQGINTNTFHPDGLGQGHTAQMPWTF